MWLAQIFSLRFLCLACPLSLGKGLQCGPFRFHFATTFVVAGLPLTVALQFPPAAAAAAAAAARFPSPQ